MVRNGYAIAKFYKPNDRYQAEFTALEKTAQESKKGLWATGGVIQTPKVAQTTPNDIITWQEASKYIGQIKTVEGKIVQTHNSGKACFLNFHSDYKANHFYLVIFPEDYAKFLEAPEKLYQDKKILVRGRIKEYQGKSEIIVKDPEQVEIMK
jgi:micrococcal nuclease